MPADNTTSNTSNLLVGEANNASSELIDVALVEFLLMHQYKVTHLFSDKEYDYLMHLGPVFEEVLFSRPLGINEHPIYDWLVVQLDAFCVWWPIEDDPLLFEPEFKDEKTLWLKEIVSMFVMGLEQRWLNPALHPQGEYGTTEHMLLLMWYLHDLIDEMFPSLKEEVPENLEETPGLVKIIWS